MLKSSIFKKLIGGTALADSSIFLLRIQWLDVDGLVANDCTGPPPDRSLGAAAAADRLALTQRLDMSVVDLPPEEPSLNLTQLVPELDLISEKDKDKKDSDEEEEVRKNN